MHSAYIKTSITSLNSVARQISAGAKFVFSDIPRVAYSDVVAMTCSWIAVNVLTHNHVIIVSQFVRQITKVNSTTEPRLETQNVYLTIKLMN